MCVCVCVCVCVRVCMRMSRTHAQTEKNHAATLSDESSFNSSLNTAEVRRTVLRLKCFFFLLRRLKYVHMIFLGHEIFTSSFFQLSSVLLPLLRRTKIASVLFTDEGYIDTHLYLTEVKWMKQSV